jgi:hypothetical protein
LRNSNTATVVDPIYPAFANAENRIGVEGVTLLSRELEHSLIQNLKDTPQRNSCMVLHLSLLAVMPLID